MIMISTSATLGLGGKDACTDRDGLHELKNGPVTVRHFTSGCEPDLPAVAIHGPHRHCKYRGGGGGIFVLAAATAFLFNESNTEEAVLHLSCQVRSWDPKLQKQQYYWGGGPRPPPAAAAPLRFILLLYLEAKADMSLSVSEECPSHRGGC